MCWKCIVLLFFLFFSSRSTTGGKVWHEDWHVGSWRHCIYIVGVHFVTSGVWKYVYVWGVGGARRQGYPCHFIVSFLRQITFPKFRFPLFRGSNIGLAWRGMRLKIEAGCGIGNIFKAGCEMTVQSFDLAMLLKNRVTMVYCDNKVFNLL